MKRIISKIFFLGIGLFLLSCGGPTDNDSQEQDANALEGYQVAPSMYDNQKGLAYVRADQPYGCNAKYDGAVASIMERVGEWQKRFSSKKVIASSPASSVNGCHGHAVIVGMFINYEPRMNPSPS